MIDGAEGVMCFTTINVSHFAISQELYHRGAQTGSSTSVGSVAVFVLAHS